MATRLSLYSSPMVPLNNASTRGAADSNRLVAKCAKNPISLDLQIRSSLKKKVFEDRSAGIVCYKDENGEITCEGYDEGPRFHQKLSRFGYNTSKDVEIIEILERCWLQVAEEKRV